MTAKQKKAIAALLAAPTVQAAAKEANVSYSTMRRWLATDKEFRQQYDEALADLVREASIQAKKSLAPALAVLREVAEDQECSAIARVQAARALVDNTMKLAEVTDIMVRLSKLEQSMEDEV